MKKMLLGLIILISFNLNSQYTLDVEDELLTFFDKENNSVHIIKKKSIISVDLNNNSSKENILSFENSPDFDFSKELVHLKVNNQNYFLQHGNGRVYSLNNYIFKRLDSSSISNAFFDSSIFTYDNKIYRYGGYGFWTIYNRLIYFDKITKQWELEKSFNTPINGIKGGLPYIYNNNLHIIGGEKKSNKSPLVHAPSNLIMTYDLIQKKWSNNYKLNNDSSYVLINKSEKEILTLLLNNNTEERSIRTLNFENNIEYIYESSPFLLSIDISKRIFQANDKLVFYISSNNKSQLNIIPINFLLSGKKINGKVLTQDYLYIYILIILLAIAAPLFLFYYTKSKKTLVLNNQGFIINNKFAELDKTSIDLISLINLKRKVSTSNLNDFIFNDNLSRASNYSRKNKILEKINNKFELISGIKGPLIIKEKSMFDLRMEVYTLNEIFRINNKIN